MAIALNAACHSPMTLCGGSGTPREYTQIVPAVTEIRTVLKDSPEFISYARSRWQFGREGAPWRGGA